MGEMELGWGERDGEGGGARRGEVWLGVYEGGKNFRGERGNKELGKGGDSSLTRGEKQ